MFDCSLLRTVVRDHLCCGGCITVMMMMTVSVQDQQMLSPESTSLIPSNLPPHTHGHICHHSRSPFHKTSHTYFLILQSPTLLTSCRSLSHTHSLIVCLYDMSGSRLAGTVQVKIDVKATVGFLRWRGWIETARCWDTSLVFSSLSPASAAGENKAHLNYSRYLFIQHPLGFKSTVHVELTTLHM